MLDRLTTGLGASSEQVYEIEGQLDLADLSQIAALDRPELKDEPWVPVTQPRLGRVPGGGAFFDELQKGDIARPSAVRVLPHELRGVRPGGRRGSRA